MKRFCVDRKNKAHVASIEQLSGTKCCGLSLQANGESRAMVIGGAPPGERTSWWSFVSSSMERIEQVKADWRAGRFEKVPGDDEYILCRNRCGLLLLALTLNNETPLMKNRLPWLIMILLYSGLMLAALPVSAQESESLIIAIDDDLDNYWVNVKKVAPQYPEKALYKQEQGCVAIGYIIEPDGTTSNHRPLAAYPSKIFNRSGITAAKRFRYEPSESNSERLAVFTFNAFTYQINSSRGADELDQQALVEVCTEGAKKMLDEQITQEAPS